MLPHDATILAEYGYDTTDDANMVSKTVSYLLDSFTNKELFMLNLKTLAYFSILLIPISFNNMSLVIAALLFISIFLVGFSLSYYLHHNTIEKALGEFDHCVRTVTIDKPMSNISKMLTSFFIMQLLNKVGFIGMMCGIISLIIIAVGD